MAGLKTVCDYLTDILCDLPGILEDVDALSMPGGLRKSTIPPLQARIITCIATLNDWWRSWLKQKRQMCFEVPVNPTFVRITDTSGPLFTTVLEFSDFWTAYELCAQNLARILLVQSLDSLSKASSELKPSGALLDESNGSPLLGISSDVTRLAHEILRCVDFCQSDMYKDTGTFCVLLPMKIAYQTLDQDSREAQWLWKRSADQLTSLNGFKIGRDILRSFSQRSITNEY